MTRRLWKALQLTAIVPVAVLSAVTTLMSFAGIGSAFSRWEVLGFRDFCGHLLFGMMLLIPLFAVYCLYFAILQEPSAIRARPWLASMVFVGLFLGSLLAVILIPLELTGENARFGLWTLILVAHVALAILHIFRIAKARPALAAEPPVAAPPVE